MEVIEKKLNRNMLGWMKIWIQIWNKILPNNLSQAATIKKMRFNPGLLLVEQLGNRPIAGLDCLEGLK